jgi:cbb3-type cytochrome oxidase maturation protein
MESVMNGMALIIAAALVMGLGGLAVLLWAIGSGQYEDMDGAAARVLLDEDGSPPREGPADP